MRQDTAAVGEMNSSTPPVFNINNKATKNLLMRRDAALQKAKDTNDLDEIREYKLLRNLCHKEIKQDGIHCQRPTPPPPPTAFSVPNRNVLYL